MNPPKSALAFLRWFCREDCLEEIEGDLSEIFKKEYDNSPRRARWKFIGSVLRYFRPEFMKTFTNSYPPNSYGMYKSYFKIGWRNLWRSKGYSIINISGLAIGMAVALVIGLWVFDELGYNKSFKNYGRIAKVYHHLTFDAEIYTHEGVPHAIGNEMKTNFAEFDEAVIATDEGEHILSYEENKFSKTGMFVEPVFLDMFSVELVQGTKAALNDVHAIMLSRTLADAVAGDSPIGKMIKFDNRDNLMITGVFEDFPSNSQFEAVKILLPLDYYFTIGESAKKQMNNWETYDFQCFVMLSQTTSLAQAEEKIRSLAFEKGSEAIKSIKPEAILLPMEKWHLFTEFKDGRNTGGKIQFVWLFGIVGIFVLTLACINFMNLSTARSEKRAKEVGIRKVMGSVRKQLVGQFLIESLLVVAIAFVSSVAVVLLSLPWFNDLTGKKMTIPWANSNFLWISAAFILITGMLAGSYPALYLSAFNPIRVLKGTFRAGRFAAIPRKAMVVFQFTISTALVIGTIVVFQQIQHAKNRPVGFDREGIIHIGIRTEDLAKANYNTLRHDLLATGVVDNMAKSDFPITGGASAEPAMSWEGKDPTYRPLIAINSCSHDFPKTNGFQFVEGRDFSRDFSTDSSALIINEMAAKLISDKSVIGKKIKFGSGKEREIIGVIKDQVRSTPFSNTWPHMYYVKYSAQGYLTIRLSPGVGVHGALDKIESVLKKHDPGAPFDYKFLDDDYARLFNDEERIGKLATVFTALAIFISCLGIFGLASFSASQRTQEIGIRKVLGASIFDVWRMLSRDFVWLVIISVLLAAPVAYYFSNQWLQKYEYRTEIVWWVFAVTGAGSLAITLLTVSYQSIRAAMGNPVDSLRAE